MAKFRWEVVRIAILVCILLLVGAWAIGERVYGPLKPDWRRNIGVAIVILRHGPVPMETISALKDALPGAEEWMYNEFKRFRNQDLHPFTFGFVGPVDIDQGPPLPRVNGSIIDRAVDGYKLYRYISAIDAHVESQLQGVDVRIYLVVRPPGNTGREARFVEGVSQKGKRYGIVHVALDMSMIVQAIIAATHESLHCVGATDKYDEEGHAIIPDGMVEPARNPQFPQDFAEIMVGEIPLGYSQGRLPHDLNEVRVGPITAREIGWTVK